MCEFIASIVILGAVEATPGWMTVHYAYHDTPTQIEEMITPIEVYDQYMQCEFPPY